MADGKVDAESKNWSWGVILLALLGAIAAPILFVLLLPHDNGYPAEILLSVLLGISVIALVVALTFAAFIFTHLKLASSDNTLGLPQGSIRAVIALSLILIFMISSVFLYEQVSTPAHTQFIDISQAEYDNISKELVYFAQPHPVNGTNVTRYTIQLQTAQNVDSVDIAKQIITTVSTLVVAVAGFYFGTNAVAAATKSVKGTGEDIETVPDPFIRKIDNGVIKGERGGKADLVIDGKNLESVKVVKLVGKDADNKDAEIKCAEGFLKNDTKISCTFNISKDDPLGSYDLVVVNTEGREDRIKNAFTVEEVKPPEGQTTNIQPSQ